MGLTVSSCLVVDGEPGRLLGLLGDETDLWEAVFAAGVFVVSQLSTADQLLSERFAGRLPTPGGPFREGEWRDLPAGPVPAAATTWAQCRLDGAKPFGWAMLVEATIVETGLAEPAPDPLVYHRGRYRVVATRSHLGAIGNPSTGS